MESLSCLREFVQFACHVHIRLRVNNDFCIRSIHGGVSAMHGTFFKIGSLWFFGT